MWSLLASLGSFSFASLYYCFMLSYYAWMCFPVIGATLGAYKFYTFYHTTSEDRYMHSLLTSPFKRRLGQATSELMDWTCDLVRALTSISYVATLVRSRLGITKKAPAPTIRPTSSQRIRDVKASLQAAGATIPRTRSLKRHNEPLVASEAPTTLETPEASNETSPTVSNGNETGGSTSDLMSGPTDDSRSEE